MQAAEGKLLSTITVRCGPCSLRYRYRCRFHDVCLSEAMEINSIGKLVSQVSTHPILMEVNLSSKIYRTTDSETWLPVFVISRVPLHFFPRRAFT